MAEMERKNKRKKRERARLTVQRYLHSKKKSTFKLDGSSNSIVFYIINENKGRLSKKW